MIRREAFCNKLRELGFSFKRQADRVCLYRRSSDGARAAVPRRDQIDETYARRELLKNGCSAEEVEAFISQCRLGQ